MKKIISSWISLTFIVLSLSGCFSDGINEPSSKDIEKSLMLKLPQIMKVNEISIEVSQNTGSEVDPQISSRFKGELELTENIYKRVDYVMGKAILREIESKGTQLKVYGISKSELKMENWNIYFEKLDISPSIDGEPLSKWKLDQYVFEGSTEEQALRKKHKEKLALDKKAEEEKLAKQKIQEEERLAKQKADEIHKRELAIKKKADDRKTLIAILTSGKAQVGESGRRNESWPFRVIFKNYDSSSNKFTGQMEWPTLSGITKIEGTIIGSSLVFKEVSHIKKGNVALNTMYELNKIENGRIKGTWNRASSQYAWFDINI